MRTLGKPMQDNIRFTGTTTRGVVTRCNELHNHATIALRAAIHDMLIENNRPAR
jgi:hypothetical protein